jgi:hypothetical protein
MHLVHGRQNLQLCLGRSAATRFAWKEQLARDRVRNRYGGDRGHDAQWQRRRGLGPGIIGG